MEMDFPNGESSSLEKFFNEVTGNIMRCALEQVALSWTEDVSMDDEDVLLEQLKQEINEGAILDSVVAVDVNLTEIKSDFEEMHSDAIYAKCCELTGDILSDVYTEVNRILQSGEHEVTVDIEMSRKKLQLIHCIKNSDRIQNFFQDISVNIIQSVLEEIRIDDSRIPKNETLKTLVMESDIGHGNINKEAGNADPTVIFQNKNQNMASLGTCQESDGQFNSSVPQDGHSLSKDELVEQDSSIELTFHSFQNENSMLKTKSTDSSGVGFTTADSVMFTTADDTTQHSSYDGESSQDRFVSFDNNSVFGFKTELRDITESIPTRLQYEEGESVLEKTLSESIVGPRQSTPLVQDEDRLGNIRITPTTDSCNVLSDGSQVISDNESDVNKSEHELQVLTDDESSMGEPWSPRTLSRQSSGFGNVTLEFDTEWEAGMQGLKEVNQNKEEKHEVILHELSFDERADLKAPDLLGPVFLAVLDDDESEESFRKRQKLSQSIDDLCEMISEDEEDLPQRRRAMSLEGKKPALVRSPRMKVPTKEELMRAFQELRNEIMDGEDLDNLVVVEEEDEGGKNEDEIEVEEEENGQDEDEDEEEDEEKKEERKEMEEEGIENVEKDEVNEEQNNEREKIDEKGNDTRSNNLERNIEDEIEQGLQDPGRWHTVIFNGQHKVIDLKLLEPFLKVLTHGGYHQDGGKKTVIVVLTACNLPNKGMRRYSLLMEQLFFFIISTMDILVTSEEYIFVYFHGGTNKNQSPSLSWLKKYYQYINRRLRKSLTKVYVVHPNLWLKSVFRLCRPFLSSNFSRKLKFVSTLKELSTFVKTDFIYIPDEVIRVDPNYRKLHAG